LAEVTGRWVGTLLADGTGYSATDVGIAVIVGLSSMVFIEVCANTGLLAQLICSSSRAGPNGLL
jgi:hypothetical protein